MTFNDLPQAVTLLTHQVSELKQLLLNRDSNHSAEEKEKLLTLKEAAIFLDLAEATIYSKVSRGELPVMKRGKRLYFSNLELIEYIKEGRQTTFNEVDSIADTYFDSKSGL